MYVYSRHIKGHTHFSSLRVSVCNDPAYVMKDAETHKHTLTLESFSQWCYRRTIFDSTKNHSVKGSLKNRLFLTFIIWRTLFTSKNLLWNRKHLQMLKVFYRTIYTKKVLLLHHEAPLFLECIYETVIQSCDAKLYFKQSLLQTSLSCDPSEIILTCWFSAQETRNIFVETKTFFYGFFNKI